jgi:hypothetical protein
MENLWNIVINKRNVELNKSFKWTVCNDTSEYKIIHNSSWYRMFCLVKGKWEIASNCDLFIYGEGTIERIRFKPMVGEVYWYVSIFGHPQSTHLSYNDENAYRLLNGNYYETCEEAEKHVEEHYKQYDNAFQ